MNHQEQVKLVDEFIEQWSKSNPHIDKGLYWSGVMDGVQLILRHQNPNEPKCHVCKDKGGWWAGHYGNTFVKCKCKK